MTRFLLEVDFTTVSSLGRPYTASFNLNTGALTTWATNPNGAVNTIAFDGSKTIF
jgi:hypothetical protein